MLNLAPLHDSINLIEIVQEAGATPKRSGKNFACACPLHNGDGPNFSIFTTSDGLQRWHCHSQCQRGGDAIEFVQQKNNLDFTEAVKHLAERYRIPLDRLGWTKKALAEHKEMLDKHGLFKQVANYYSTQMWQPEDDEGSPNIGLKYARSRGLSEDHLKQILWGYSKGSKELLSFLAAADNLAPLIPIARKTGLIRADGLDFTANVNGQTVSPAGWLIYPHWHYNKIISFSARAISEIEKGSKSRNLPGPRTIYRADTPLEGEKTFADELIIVEGQADAETVRAWGYPAIALCGVSIRDIDDPDSPLHKLKSRSQKTDIYLGLSNDKPGQKAALTLAPQLSPLAQILLWPSWEAGQTKSDANMWLTEKEATRSDFEDQLQKSRPYIDLAIENIEYEKNVRKQAEGIEKLAGLVSQLNETQRTIYIRSVGLNKHLLISQSDFGRLVTERLEADPPSGIHIKRNQFYQVNEPLTNFICYIAHELSRNDGENVPDIIYTIQGQLSNEKILRPIDIPASEFDSLSWISGNWGARPIIYVGNGKRHVLLRAIKELGQEQMTREQVYTFTGWHKDKAGKNVFLTMSGALGADGLDETVRVDLPGNLARYNLPLPLYGGDLIEAVQSSLNFLNIAPLSITAPLLSSMVAAPLTPFKSLNAIVWVYGPTQSKKSSLSHLALTHLGEKFIEGRDYKSVKDWTSTRADLEATMFDIKDMPLIIDDYAPQFTDAMESRKQAKAAHYVTRSIGNRSSRGRRRADMTAQKQFIPRGLVMATAEQPLIGQSIVGRMVYVEIEIGSVDIDALSQAQADHHHYSQAMSAFISWIARNWEMLEKTLPPQFQEAQEQVSYPNQDRLTDYYAIQTVALETYITWASEIGAIHHQEAKQLIKSIRLTIEENLDKQSTRISGQSPILKFFEGIETLLSEGRAVLPDRTNVEYIVPDRAILIGWVDYEKNQVLLITNSALKMVKDHWSRLDERYDTLIDALRREMWQYGFLAEREKRQFEKRKWINTQWGKTGIQRVLVIDAEKVEEEFDIDLVGKPIHLRTDPEADTGIDPGISQDEIDF